MSNCIKIIDPSIIEKIAAGEVIERPSSIIKELVENSIDANSKSIEINIDKGGIDLIIIKDNGDGIVENDIKLAFKRHATSKISTLNDLNKISTLGFRGEALPSIASVSHVNIKTSDKNNNANEFTIQAGEEGILKPSSRSKGTTQKDFLEKSVRLFRSAIQIDKLFLTAYENLIYVYKAMGEDAKALKTHKAFVKSRDRLLNSFSKDEQTKLGMGVPYVFRVRLGTYGVYTAPVELYDQEYLITVPVNERQTSFLAGMFYNLKDAQVYLKKMQKNGFQGASIAAFKDGEITEF